MTGPRSAWLFCPADRPDRFGKAFDRADVVILDLEDAVAPDRKADARRSLAGVSVDPERTVLRVNAVGTDDHADDLTAACDLGITMLMVPKAEDPGALDHLAPFRVVALCETAAGVESAPQLARHPLVEALMWGAEDLVASMGGRASRDPHGRYHDLARTARVRVLLAAHAAGVAAIDAVYLDIPDLDGLRAEVAEAVDSGFSAKACIHPSQVAVIRAAFRPTPAQVAWAESVLAAGAAGGVVRVGGQMVDGPLLNQAATIMAAHRETADGGG